VARALRVEFPGAVYHVQARGCPGEPVFADDTDRERFLSILAGVAFRCRLICYAYCLLEEEYHLLLETPEANISRAMRQLNGVYGQSFARRHGRKGQVFGTRFRARLVEKESYLPEVARDLVLRPVRAGLVSCPSQWRWSSYPSMAGDAPTPSFLASGWFARLNESRTVAEARESYRSFVARGLEEEDPLRPLEKSPIVGRPAFADALRPRLHDAALAHSAGPSRVLRPRPSLPELLHDTREREVRNASIRKAYLQYGYTMKAIGDQLHLHYSTVSRILGTD